MKLTLSNLWLKRGDKNIFRGLNLTLTSCTVNVLKGANGSGKTSLLKLIAGIINPSRGKLMWHEMPQTPPLHFLSHKGGISLSLTPLENLRFALCLKGAEFDFDKVSALLAEFKLDRVANQLCQKLSQGERRKVSLIEVILAQRPVWLLDEPFNVLDKSSTELFCQYAKAHQNQGGLVILSSHQPVVDDFLEIEVASMGIA
jgi:heme exporter protein A